MITEGQEGLKVPPDDPVSLAHAIDRILSDEPFRRHLAAGARKRAERLSLENMAGSFRRLLQNICTGPGSAASTC